MNDPLYFLVFLSGAILFAALIGGIIPFLRHWEEYHLHGFISLGAGTLLGAAFVFMIPEATKLIGASVGIAILSGFLVFYCLERFVMIHPCREEECEFHHIGFPAFLGFSLHNLVDGVALGTSFLIPHLTPIIFIALITHHIPTSFCLASILKAGTHSSKRSLLLLTVFALMVPIGAFAGYFTAMHWDSFIIGWAIAFSAGTFIHIATCDLLPEIHKLHETKYWNLGYLILGLAIVGLLSLLVGH